MCPQRRAHWHHLANTIKHVLPSAHLSPHPKRQIDRFSRFCTAHGRKCLYFTMGDPFPIALSRGDRDLHLFHDTLRHTEPTIQTASRSVELFSHRQPHSVPRLTMGVPFPKSAPSHGGSVPPCKTRFLGPTEPTDQTTSLSVQPFLHR